MDPISEFFNFDTMEWSYGPNIYEGDLNYCYGASVPYQGSFLLAGGFRTQDSIYFYDSDAFVLLDQRLVEGGWENPALLVDDKIVNCSS